MIHSHLIQVARLVVLLAALAGAANAAAPRFEITPFAAYRDGGQFQDGNGTALDLRGSLGGALAIDWRAGWQDAQYELFYSRQSTETAAVVPVHMNIEYLHIGGTTRFGELDSPVEPFAVGGIGLTWLTPETALLHSETRASLNVGGGVRIPLATHVRLRLEARGYLTWMGGNAALFCSGGCILTVKGNAFFQYEVLAGVSVGF